MYLAKKDGNVYCHKTLEGLQKNYGIKKADMEVPDAEFEAAGGFARIAGNKIVVGKTPEEKAAGEALESAEKETAQIKAEIASRDYRALKAQKLGKSIDQLYPGETDWYKAQIARLSELEAVIEENKAAA